MKEFSGAYHCLGDVKKGIRALERKNTNEFLSLSKHVKTCEGLFLNLQTKKKMCHCMILSLD